MDDISRRLERVEEKIDRQTEILTSIARVEEKISGQNARLKRHEFRLDENEHKIEEVAETLATNSQIIKVGQGLVASIWAAILAAVLYFFGEG
ncbi:MAG: hypothetical protein CL885_03775 [Dehalococcoidia bacterium]|nr:hypothetical protein [Dehalococcoidia bacterium]|tara:strand:- start:494 stop:772 length:279 start_codon:yes stop_codon:yes gene_type:complete